MTIVAEADSQIVSVCGIDREGPQYRIRHNALLGISITQAWCGRGLGTVLMTELIGWAEVCPELDVVWLGVCDGNDRAVSVYRKLGFELTGRRPSRVKFKGRYCDELTMSRWVGVSEVVS